jgi:hypothetical protein
VALYREWINSDDPKAVAMRQNIDELRGKDLLCFCPVPGRAMAMFFWSWRTRDKSVDLRTAQERAKQMKLGPMGTGVSRPEKSGSLLTTDICFLLLTRLGLPVSIICEPNSTFGATEVTSSDHFSQRRPLIRRTGKGE